MFKRLFMLFFVFLVAASMQANAQQLNYQAIARNANGVALTFRDVGIRLSIRDGSPVGSIVYSESRNIRTNQFGLFTVIIGSPGASNVMGSMASINWISGNKYLQVEIDPEGGTNYFQAGTSQLQAVPYALFANAAYPVGPAGGDLLGSSYPNPIIAPLVITTGKIANQAITTPKIADLNVTTAKLEDQAVTNPKIADNTIANIKLVNSRVTLNGLVLNLGDVQDFAVGNNGTDVNIVSAGNTHTFNFPDATSFSRGLVTTVAQTFGGNKTFNNDITATRIIRAGGIAAQFLKADGSVDNNIYLTENQPIIVTATGDATGVSTSSRTAPVLPLTLATVNSAVGTYGTNLVIPSITVNNKGLVTNVVTNPIPTATATINGLLNTGDWNRFNNKQNAISLGTTAQYFRGDLTLSNFQTDVRNQLSAGTNITYNNGNIGLTNNSVTLNTLPLTLGGSQTFATGTTGVDFNISSVGSVHTFNIPTASVFARGLLSSSDYTNFNAAFTNRISSLTTTGTSGPATLSANVLNIPNYTYTLPAATATILGGIISGANITNTSGTISVTSNNVINALGSQTANRFLVAPNGSNGLPTFRAMATGDIPDNIVTNIKLANSNIILGTTNIPLGGTANSLLGLTSVTSGTFVGPLTGNASTASTWANARTISTTGDVLYTSNPFDGSGNTTGVATLANSGVTAGSYGSSSTIPSFTVDAKGRLTSATSFPISGISTLGSSLNSGNIIVGSAANIAAQVPMSGDVTISPLGVTTIGALKVTDAMLAGGITDGKLATISTAGKVANSATTATQLNNINTIVLRDGSGNFSAGTITANLTGNVTGNVTGTAGSVVNNLTYNNSGAGDISGTTFNGAAARTLSYNSIGASPLAGSTSLTTLGTITTGTWNGSIIGSAFGGAGSTNGLLKANGAGLVSAATVGTDYLAPFTSQTQNFVFAAPTGASGTPSFRALAISDIPTLNQNTTGSAGSVLNSVSFNNGGAGDASGTTFNGAAARTISYNSIGASPLAGSTSLTTLGTITTGTWNGNVIGNAFGGAGTTNGLLKANGTGLVSAATVGTDYLAPFASQTQNFIFAAPAGASGTPSFRAIAVSDIPTLNQNTTGSAGSVLNNFTFNNSGVGDISGTSFNGAAARTLSYNSIGASPLAGSTSLTTVGTITAGTWNGNIIGSAFGGTGNGFTRFTGPTITERIFTLPDVDATILTTNATVTIAQGGTGQTTKTTAFDALSPMTTLGDIIYGAAAGTGTRLPVGTSPNGSVLTLAAGIPSWSNTVNWKTNGNAGLDATNFLGTTDPVALRFKVEDINSGIITTNTAAKFNTSFGLGTSIFSDIEGFRNSAFGAGAMTAITKGDDNTAVGQNALISNQEGSNNTAIGQSALANTIGSLINGNSNTAVGQAAMQTNTTGLNNTAMGKDALFTNLTGENNTAIGHFSARLSTGSRNTALGQSSLPATTGNDNIGVGFNARVAAGLSNSIAIGSGTIISSENSIAIGTPATVATSSANSIAIGTTSTSSNAGAIALGLTTTASGENAVAIGTGANNATAETILLGGPTNSSVRATGSLTATGRITGTGARFGFYETTGIPYAITINDYYIKVNTSVTVTLPTAVGISGQRFVIYNGTGGNYNSIATTSGQTIIGASWSGSLGIAASLKVFSDGVNWLAE